MKKKSPQQRAGYHLVYSEHIGITWFLGVGCMSRAHTQYKIKASKRLGSTN
jgi:hypothetical protein